jgi:hypothetical protein
LLRERAYKEIEGSLDQINFQEMDERLDEKIKAEL